MPQMLTSQNKPECESQDHFEWCQLSARQPVSQKYHVSVFVCCLYTHPCECVSLYFSMCECYLCRYKCASMCCAHQCVLVILDVYVSSSGGRVQPWRDSSCHPFHQTVGQIEGKKNPRDKEVSPWLAHRRLPGARQVHSHVPKRKKERTVNTRLTHEGIHWWPSRSSDTQRDTCQGWSQTFNIDKYLAFIDCIHFLFPNTRA